jgi:hypothetical protein
MNDIRPDREPIAIVRPSGVIAAADGAEGAGRIGTDRDGSGRIGTDRSWRRELASRTLTLRASTMTSRVPPSVAGFRSTN